KGEFAFAVSNFRMKQAIVPGYNITTNSPALDFLFCAPVADKKSYDKIINTLAKIQPDMFVNKNGQMVPAIFAQNGSGTAFLANDKNLIIASSQGLLDSFANGTGHISLPDDAAKNMKGKTSYVYGDFKNILSNIPAEGSDSALVVLSKNTFDYFNAWGNEISGNSFKGEAHLKFQNEKQNSLITLLNYFQQIKTASDSYKSSVSSSGSTTSDSDDMNTNIAVPSNVDTTK
ncbi:MAG TPA: hypothetical protein VGB84_01610, partial [Arachidicoccus sp.]